MRSVTFLVYHFLTNKPLGEQVDILQRNNKNRFIKHFTKISHDRRIF